MKKTKITYKHITAILFSIIVLGFFITIGERFVRSSVLHHHFTDEVTTDTDAIEDLTLKPKQYTDWSKTYPIQLADDKEEEQAETVKEAEAPDGKISTALSTYETTAKTLETGVNYYTNNLLFLRMKFVELNASFNKLIGMKLISGSDDVLVLADGNLTYYPKEYDITKSAQNLSEFSEFVDGCGSKLIYVQAPSKVDPDNNYLPGGITDYDNQKADELLKILGNNGVDYLDLRKSMKAQKMNFTNCFYRTDHHWKGSLGVWAANEITKAAQKYNMPYDKEKLNTDNYNEVVYKDFMFGSLGKKVSLAYADPEDFSIYMPKFDTDFTVDYCDFRILNGSFKDTMINNNVLKEKNYYNGSTYGSYFYGVTFISKVENHLADNDYHVVVIGDSFSNSVVPYLSTQVKYLDRIDLRCFSGGIRSYVEKEKPDLVIVLYYPGTLFNCEHSTMRFR